MTPELEIKSIIKKLEGVQDLELLRAIKDLLNFGLKKEKNHNIEQFVGIISDHEAKELELIIAEGCETIDDE